MEEEPSDFETLADTDILICIFPHVREFLVVDTRRDAVHTPAFRVISTEDTFTKDFYQQVEQSFAELLRSDEPPFTRFIGLPARLEGLMRQRGLEFILKKVAEGDLAFKEPRISLVLCTGPLLSLEPEKQRVAIQTVFGDKADPGQVKLCLQAFGRLLQEERATVKGLEDRFMRDVITGDSPFFPPLWEGKN